MRGVSVIVSSFAERPRDLKASRELLVLLRPAEGSLMSISSFDSAAGWRATAKPGCVDYSISDRLGAAPSL